MYTHVSISTVVKSPDYIMSYFVSGINAVRETLRKGDNIIEILTNRGN